MSKNVVDAIAEFCNETQNSVGLIPSRRQVEFNGGYVNNWNTKDFSEYAEGLLLVRDHSGPGQGYLRDDGYISLLHDCRHLNIIHIDPWKAYPSYEDGLKWTVDMINFCHTRNPDVRFEVGTEESIRRFTSEELDQFVNDLSSELSPEAYKQIDYLVVQSGTALKGNENTGDYDKHRLARMVEVCKKYELLSKEHNGDYLPVELIKEKFDLGLDSINIAPEFGQIETQTYLSKIKGESPELLEIFYKICYLSKRWEKWIAEDFDPLTQKEELINICGHYVLSDEDFINEVKSNFENIDVEIKQNIKEKLIQLTQ